MSTITQYASYFFSPQPKSVTASESKATAAKRVVTYLESSSGVWDFSRVCELFFTYLKTLPVLNDAYRLGAEKISGVFALTGSALSLPQLATDVHAWFCNLRHLFTAAALPEYDSQRDAQVTFAAKKVFLSTSDVGNTVSQALIFFNDAKLMDLAKHMPVISFFFNFTSLFSDGVQSVQEACKINKYRTKLQMSPLASRVQRWEGKLNLAWMKIAQAVSSVGMAAMGLASLAVGVAITSVPVLSAISLGLLTTWLTMKISSYFYEKSLEERRLSTAI